MSQLIGKRFEVHKPIGEGAMGEVYLGMDTLTGERVAIKALKSSIATPDLIARFEREGEALRQLNHPNIVKVLASFEDSGQHYIMMEYVGGGSLRDQLTRTAQLPVEQVLKIGLELSDALTRAHLLNIVHRDIKPANILIADDGTPRLSDFGIASVKTAPRVTQTGAMVGTIDYLSPEACRGEAVDSRADIWAFGVMLYEMLAGDVPFKGNNVAAIINGILHNPHPDLSQLRDDIPPDLVDLINRMLVKDRAERVSSIRLVGADIEAILQGARTSTYTMRSVSVTDSQSTTLGVPVITNNLPTQNTPFVGREKELGDIDQLLCDPAARLITLMGPGGIGKTRLSLEIASRQLHNEGCFTDGVFFVALAPLTTQDSIIIAIAEAVQFSFFGSDDPQTQLMNYLREKDMLMVLDNFEHLIQCSTLVTDLLEAAPKLKIITTTREKLNLRGEWIFNVEGMTFPDWRTPDDLLEYGAIQLFLQSAKRAQPRFQLTEETQDAVVRIVQLVQGMPLGIELAAAWLEMLSLEEIISEIEHSLDFLETDLRDVPERHRSLRSVFDYSWNLMNDDERSGFSKLSVFKGGFTREAAAAVTGALLRPLTMLVNKSLIHRLPSGRYEVHELLRQYAAEKLAESPETEHAILVSHADYYLNLLTKVPTALTQEAQDYIALIGDEHENIRCAIQCAIREQCTEQLTQAIPLLRLFYETRNLHREGVETLGQIADAFRHNPAAKVLYTRAIIGIGTLLNRVSRYQESRDLLTEAVGLAKEINDPSEVTWGLVWLSYAHMSLGELSHSLELGQEAVEVGKTDPKSVYYSTALAHLGYVYYLLGDYEQAKTLMEKAHAINRENGSKFALAYNLNNLGEVMRAMGSLKEAKRLFEESHRLFSDIGYLRGMAFSINNLGGLTQMMGDLAEAEQMYRKSHRLNKQIGDRTGIGHSLSAMGNMSGLQGRYQDALKFYSQALELRRELHDQRGVAESLLDLGDAEARLGQYELATQHTNESLTIYRQIGDKRSESNAIIILAELEMRQHNFTAAKTLLERSLALDEQASSMGKGWALTDLSWVEIMLGNYQTAKTLLDSIGVDESQTEYEWAYAWGLGLYGFVERGLGNRPQARELFLKALSLGVKTRHWIALNYALIGVAHILADEGDAETALRLVLPAINPTKQYVYAICEVQGNNLVNELRPKLSATTFASIQAQVNQQSSLEVAQAFLKGREKTIAGV